MNARRIVYSPAELAWLSDHRTLPRGDYAAAFNARFGRALSPRNLHQLRRRMGWKSGRDGRFQPGHVGSPPNAEGARFQKGQRGGFAAALYKPVGTERLSPSGYRERKIHDGKPEHTRWRAIHLIEWEAAHGPIPAGWCLKCLGDDKTDVRPQNWRLIPRAMLPALNGGKHKRRPAYDEAAPEVKPTLMALAEVEHAARELVRRGGA